MRAVALFTSLASVASALPSLAGRELEANGLQTRQGQRILDYTVTTWPTQGTLYNNQSYELVFLTPKTDTTYIFDFQNSNPLNAGFDTIFAVTGEGLGTIADTVKPGKVASHTVEKTNKPFRITIDRTS